MSGTPLPGQALAEARAIVASAAVRKIGRLRVLLRLEIAGGERGARVAAACLDEIAALERWAR